MADVDLNAPVQQAQQNKQNLTALFGTQRNEGADFLNRFSGAINGQEKSSAMAERIGSELGLPTLQKNSQALQTTLFNLPSTYSKATTGYDVNANQLARVVGTKQAEIAPAASLAQQNVQNAENTLNTRMGYEQADQSKALLPFQTEQSMLSERMARETSGYTSAMQSELDAIVAKMNAGVQISEAEKNRAHELSVLEKQFQNQKELQSNDQKFQSSQNSKDPFVTIGEGSTLFNTSTGQKIYTAPKTATPSNVAPQQIQSYYRPPVTTGAGANANMSSTGNRFTLIP